MEQWLPVGKPENLVFYNILENNFYQIRLSLGREYKMFKVHPDSVKALSGCELGVVSNLRTWYKNHAG
ncbi:hypothetical protein C4T52_10310 [Clostridioides difficile]